MSDHASSPRAFADPVVDITDMFAFPSPERPGTLVLVLDAFPFAGISALFSNAVEYRFRIRPASIARSESGVQFSIGEKEYRVACRFGVPATSDAGSPVQEGTCTTSTGQTVRFTVNDERGAESDGLRVFAGVRMDPFFFDGRKALETMMTRKLAFSAQGNSTMFRQNALSIVVELDVGKTFAAGDGPLFAIVGETVTTGPMEIRLERYGRPDVKNLLIFPNQFDTVNREIELRDLYNQEDAFKLGPAYAKALRTRMNANLVFWDSIDEKTDWQPSADGIHPLMELFLADFMIVDVSKPFAQESYFEIERSAVKGTPHQTCGGRSLNDDAIDTFLTVMINGGNGPRISDGVDQATVPASSTFPYLAPPEPNPPKPQAPQIVTK
ncbi:MAG TPA: DUF4331 family protein [Candidatus Aquilonibacter sp.]